MYKSLHLLQIITWINPYLDAVAVRMSPAFSDRGRSNIEAIMPKIKAAVEERESKMSSKIDLSTAENWLIRPELMELCKEAINEDLTAAVRRIACITNT
jgi:hypothetical protein